MYPLLSIKFINWGILLHTFKYSGRMLQGQWDFLDISVSEYTLHAQSYKSVPPQKQKNTPKKYGFSLHWSWRTIIQLTRGDKNSTWDQSYIISAGIPAVQNFWTMLIALPIDIWPTLTTSRSHELTETWRESKTKELILVTRPPFPLYKAVKVTKMDKYTNICQSASR